MSIPKFHEIRPEALRLLTENPELKLQEFETPLAKTFMLTEEEIAQKYNSGNGKVFYDRISWALSYLYMAGLVTKPKRGVYQINDLGRDMLKTPEKIEEFLKKTLQKRDAGKQKTAILTESTADLTPQEELYNSSEKIRRAACDEILETILRKSPREFESLVVALLQHMGYGGEIKDAATVTQYSNDGGIDGIIKEDVLGLGRIHIQAKRYTPSSTIGRDEIQKFVGALAVAQSNKGVFITTSSYSKGAIEYVKGLTGSTTVILIDGNELAFFIYDFGLGMQVEQTIEIKKMDSDFWDSMEDDLTNRKVG